MHVESVSLRDDSVARRRDLLCLLFPALHCSTLLCLTVSVDAYLCLLHSTALIGTTFPLFDCASALPAPFEHMSVSPRSPWDATPSPGSVVIYDESIRLTPASAVGGPRGVVSQYRQEHGLYSSVEEDPRWVGGTRSLQLRGPRANAVRRAQSTDVHRAPGPCVDIHVHSCTPLAQSLRVVQKVLSCTISTTTQQVCFAP